MSGQTVTHELVLLRGSSLLHAETLQPIVTLGEDGVWRTPDGAITDAIGVPQQAPQAIVRPAEQLAADKARDAAWIKRALTAVRDVAAASKHVTVDDVRTALTTQPRKPSLMSTLMVAAARDGLIEHTDAHRRSSRQTNGGRTVRVWRSRVYAGEL